MWNLVSYPIRRFGRTFNLGSPCVAMAVGTVLGLLVLTVGQEMSGWSRYRLLFLSGMALMYLATLVLREIRRVLLVSLVVAIPLNFAFAPLGRASLHAGGAPAGMVLYPYDFPLILIIVLWLLEIVGTRKPIQFSNVDVAALLLIIWTAVSIYNSSYIRLSLFELLRMTKLYLLSLVVAGNVKRKRDIRDVVIALGIGLMLQGVICLLQYVVGTDLGLGLFTVGDLHRVSGTVGWPNTLGAYAATVLSVTLALWIYGARGRLRTLIGAACMAGLFPLILSFSRGAWISLLVGVAISVFLGWRAARLGTRGSVKLVGIALSFAMVGTLFASSVAARLAEVHPGMDIIVDRMKLNQVALNMIGAHPLLGAGINTFVDTMKQYDTTGVTYYFPQPVHNVFLLVAAETGLVGLGLFLLLMFMAFQAGLQASKSDDRFLSACAIGITSGLVVLAVNNLADVHLRTDVLYALFWLLIGLAVAVKRMTISAAFLGYDENFVTRSRVSDGEQPYGSTLAKEITQLKGGEALLHMKIAVLVYSLNRIGGIAKHALHVARELAAMGHQVTVWSVEYDKDLCYPELTRGLDVQALRPAPPPAPDEVQGPPGIRMLAYMWSLWKFYRDQHRLCLAMPDGYDVVNAHGNTISWAAAAYKRRHGTPVVWMCNDFWPMASHRGKVVSNAWEKVKHIVKEGLCLPFYRYDQAAVREIDRIVVLSERVKSQMTGHYGVDPVVVRAGVEISRFSRGDGRKIRARYLDRDSSFLLLTVCVLMPRRRIEDVIRATRILAGEGLDVTYLVVGRTSHSPAYVQFLQTEVSALDLGDRVKFVGEVPEEVLVDCYHASDAFIWAADDNQSWGLAGMEAMAAGKPIIVSKANGLAEVLEDGKTALLVTPRSPEAIAGAVKGLMKDSALAKSVASQGQRLVREEYSWRKNAEATVDLFYGAMGKR